MTREEQIEKENQILERLFDEYKKFYNLHEGIDIKEITEELLASPLVREEQKKSIRQHARQVFVFSYPSDGLQIKGFLSFVPFPENHPLLVYLRGGNELFGIVNPGNDSVCYKNYTVLATMYRGGVSEGRDEFGGEDVNDVKHLVDYIPELEEKLKISLQSKKKFLLGCSRGGMQMFLALARYPSLQAFFSKIVSLSGLLDLRHCIVDRPDMLKMFEYKFGFLKEKNWIERRDPLQSVDNIRKDLPILIIQSQKDLRVTLAEGLHMVEKLKSSGRNVTYWEFEQGDHCLSNKKDLMQLITAWLEA